MPAVHFICKDGKILSKFTEVDQIKCLHDCDGYNVDQTVMTKKMVALSLNYKLYALCGPPFDQQLPGLAQS